ncbi:hypothetical protein [Sphingomonas kyeonggiensis]|uniref:Uncharacterized protein n=1 Tax=Sphingomonas kyeonggiensis TaxID=1268553 RepID=A0A7W6NYR6_9SPHN|nr:hypothetical protein [Sphingomonas kyeonggiensis]MBB4100056.1 hypothetical protein [Sphingomonas kyeonggiensis]
MMRLVLSGMLVSLAAAPAFAQSSSTQTVINTPVGPVTKSETVSPIGNGTVSTTTVTPGNGNSVGPYVGTTTTDLYPNKTPGTTVPHAGIVIPFGSSKPGKATPQ